jgi:hypothetical protein
MPRQLAKEEVFYNSRENMVFYALNFQATFMDIKIIKNTTTNASKFLYLYVTIIFPRQINLSGLLNILLIFSSLSIVSFCYHLL